MSAKATLSSLRVAQCSPTRLTELVGQELLSEYSFEVERTHGIDVTADQIVSVDENGMYVQGSFQIGENGKPSTDSSRFASKIMDLIDHRSCLTGETEGYPVWFDNAAWCNECEVLLPADTVYVGEVECTCGSEFPREGIMRATVPSVLMFEEYIEFENRVETVEEVLVEMRRAL